MAILTVSRQFGSGSTDVLEEVMSSVDYTLVTKKTLLNDIRTSGAEWETWAREFDETSPNLWEKYDRSFLGFGALLQSLVLNYALRDNVILKGRGANFLLEGIPYAFRTRFVASLEDRLERVALWDAVDEETAGILIANTDKGRAGFVKALYNKDVNDSRYYDTVFDTSRQSFGETADIIKKTLIARDGLNTPEARKLLAGRAISAKIKAKLITDPQLYVPVIDVKCEEAGLVLRGIVRSSDQFRRIVQAAQQLAEDWPVKVELRYRV